jgi:hypothetical protein
MRKQISRKWLFFFNGFNSFGGSPAYTAFVYKAKTNSISERDFFGVGNLGYTMWLLESKQIKDNWFWVDLFENYGR